MTRKTPTLQGQIRSHTGSKYALRVRRAGKLPAVIYGHQQAVAHVALDAQAVTEVLHAGAHVVEVALDGGQNETCLIKAVQYDYLGDNLIHLDLTRIDLSEEVTVSVPLIFKGQDQCAALKESGAFLDRPMANLEVSCRADSIPDSIVIAINNMKLDDVITLADITMPDGVRSELPGDTVLAALHVMAEEEAVAATGEAGSAEPEVIAEKKAEEPAAEE